MFSMFSCYGGAEFALKKARIPFECVGYSEIDKAAIKCYDQNHPNITNYGDCTKINPLELPDFDLLTGGFPCQSFSVAGKGLGELDTRGTLFNDIIRIAEVKQPKYVLLENVKGLTNKKHEKTFNKILSEIKRIGYECHWGILNSKEYGTPQNRERVFFVCFRKDLFQEWYDFQFPDKEELKLEWKDFVDIPTNYVKVNKTPSRDKMRVRCKNITNKQVCGTITLKQDRFPNAGIIDFEDYYRFLTPRECFRLMGFFNDEINLDGLSKTQQYKLAGNGWDINLVSKIFKQMFGDKNV